jgi:hypothetical protein
VCSNEESENVSVEKASADDQNNASVSSDDHVIVM